MMDALQRRGMPRASGAKRPATDMLASLGSTEARINQLNADMTNRYLFGQSDPQLGEVRRNDLRKKLKLPVDADQRRFELQKSENELRILNDPTVAVGEKAKAMHASRIAIASDAYYAILETEAEANHHIAAALKEETKAGAYDKLAAEAQWKMKGDSQEFDVSAHQNTANNARLAADVHLRARKNEIDSMVDGAKQSAATSKYNEIIRARDEVQKAKAAGVDKIVVYTPDHMKKLNERVAALRQQLGNQPDTPADARYATERKLRERNDTYKAVSSLYGEPYEVDELVKQLAWISDAIRVDPKTDSLPVYWISFCDACARLLNSFVFELGADTKKALRRTLREAAERVQAAAAEQQTDTAASLILMLSEFAEVDKSASTDNTLQLSHRADVYLTLAREFSDIAIAKRMVPVQLTHTLRGGGHSRELSCACVSIIHTLSQIAPGLKYVVRFKETDNEDAFMRNLCALQEVAVNPTVHGILGPAVLCMLFQGCYGKDIDDWMVDDNRAHVDPLLFSKRWTTKYSTGKNPSPEAVSALAKEEIVWQKACTSEGVDYMDRLTGPFINACLLLNMFHIDDVVKAAAEDITASLPEEDPMGLPAQMRFMAHMCACARPSKVPVNVTSALEDAVTLEMATIKCASVLVDTLLPINVEYTADIKADDDEEEEDGGASSSSSRSSSSSSAERAKKNNKKQKKKKSTEHALVYQGTTVAKIAVLCAPVQFSVQDTEYSTVVMIADKNAIEATLCLLANLVSFMSTRTRSYMSYRFLCKLAFMMSAKPIKWANNPEVAAIVGEAFNGITSEGVNAMYHFMTLDNLCPKNASVEICRSNVFAAIEMHNNKQEKKEEVDADGDVLIPDTQGPFAAEGKVKPLSSKQQLQQQQQQQQQKLQAAPETEPRLAWCTPIVHCDIDSIHRLVTNDQPCTPSSEIEYLLAMAWTGLTPQERCASRTAYSLTGKPNARIMLAMSRCMANNSTPWTRMAQSACAGPQGKCKDWCHTAVDTDTAAVNAAVAIDNVPLSQVETRTRIWLRSLRLQKCVSLDRFTSCTDARVLCQWMSLMSDTPLTDIAECCTVKAAREVYNQPAVNPSKPARQLAMQAMTEMYAYMMVDAFYVDAVLDKLVCELNEQQQRSMEQTALPRWALQIMVAAVLQAIVKIFGTPDLADADNERNTMVHTNIHQQWKQLVALDPSITQFMTDPDEPLKETEAMTLHNWFVNVFNYCSKHCESSSDYVTAAVHLFQKREVGMEAVINDLAALRALSNDASRSGRACNKVIICLLQSMVTRAKKKIWQ
jgi:hypothetical protein